MISGMWRRNPMRRVTRPTMADRYTTLTPIFHTSASETVLRIRIRMLLCLLDPDPLVQRHGSGSGSFYHQAKKIRKTLIPTVLLILFDFLSLKNYVNVHSKSNKQKKKYFNLFFVGLLKVNDETENRRIWIRIQDPDPNSQRHGSADPDPHQNVMDPQHCHKYIFIQIFNENFCLFSQPST
jgi:hypothetical protein